MRIVPSRLMALTRAAVHQVDGKFYADGREHTANWAPTGVQVSFPATYTLGAAEFGDAAINPSYATPAYEHGRMYMEDGSLSVSDKPLMGQGPTSGYGADWSTPLNSLQGYLYQFDSRLPYHFNSVLGLTTGKKYIATNRGLMETKPRFKRAMPAKLDMFAISSYNGLTQNTGNGYPSQQLILGETDTELFGVSWTYIPNSLFIVANPGGGQTGSSLWRSVKRVGDIDNTTGIRVQPNTTSDIYEATYIGKFGEIALFLRINSTSTGSFQYIGLVVRPMAFNLRTGLVNNPATPYSYPISIQSGAGLRFAPHVRSVVETPTLISVYLPCPVCTSDNTADGTLTGMVIKRFDFTKATGLWAEGVNVTIADGPYGDIIAKGQCPAAGTHQAQTVVSSWIIDVQGVKHLVVAIFGTNNYLVNSTATGASYFENTHQYVYRINEDGTLTRVSKTISPRLFGVSEVQAGFSMSQDRKALYFNMYSPRIYRLVFDETTMAYQHDLQYEIDAWTMHVADDETLTIIDTSLNLTQLKPMIGTAVRATFGTIGEYDGQTLLSDVKVAVMNHLGVRVAAQVKLELDGPVSFTANGLQTLVVNTSDTGDLAVPIQITGAGEIYCTPVRP